MTEQGPEAKAGKVEGMTEKDLWTSVKIAYIRAVKDACVFVLDVIGNHRVENTGHRSFYISISNRQSQKNPFWSSYKIG